jgi:hypothetical protein
MSDDFYRFNSADQDKKLDAELLTVNGLPVYQLRVQAAQAPAPSYALRLDDTGTGTVYVGEAAVGSAEGDPVWRIKKILTVGSDMTILWADGNASFDNSWTGRVGLSYS